jgi:hypothetical protein
MGRQWRGRRVKHPVDFAANQDAEVAEAPQIVSQVVFLWCRVRDKSVSEGTSEDLARDSTTAVCAEKPET